jgi:acid phosphatase type 7
MNASSAVPALLVPRRTSLTRLATEQVQKQHGFRANQAFQPLPPPTGDYPYRLILDAVLGNDAVAAIRNAGKLVLHMMGDTGGVKSPQPQHIVAVAMERDFTAPAGDRPSFLYLLGDVIYFHGERSEYYSQLYEPYATYPAPIMAIPGNHDGDPVPGGEPSLGAFVDNFCSKTPHRPAEAQETNRDTMIQPNVFWTLRAPFLTIIGLYSNVPEGGRLDDHQIAWLRAELAAAPRDAILLVTLHHPLYSADAHHGGSAYLGDVLDTAFHEAGRIPDGVFTGHVHNYQRFTRPLGGRPVPYVVAGAGGYWHLHAMARDDTGEPLPTPWPVPGTNLTLENYAADRHGYLRLTASSQGLRCEYVTVPRPHESWHKGPITVADSFTINPWSPP